MSMRVTPGRIVLYCDTSGWDQPAMVALQPGFDNFTNLTVFDNWGNVRPERYVPYWDHELGTEAPPRFWHWMEFQKGQAAKVDNYEPRIAALEEVVSRLQARLEMTT